MIQFAHSHRMMLPIRINGKDQTIKMEMEMDSEEEQMASLLLELIIETFNLINRK